MNTITSTALLAVVIGLCACSHSETDHTHDTPDARTGHTSPYPTCQAIIDQCHELDVGEGPIHDCHEVAHDAKSDGDCVAQKAKCASVCVATDGGVDAADGG